MSYWPWTGWISPQREALRRLRHIANQNDRILSLLAPEGELMSDLQSITAAVEAESTVVDSAVTLLTQLAADIAASKNDPVAIQAIVDNVTAQTATLANAVAANTVAAPEPAPVDAPPADESADQPPADVPVDTPPADQPAG